MTSLAQKNAINITPRGLAVFEIYHWTLDPGEITEPCSYARRPLSVGTHQVRSLETTRQELIEAVSNSQTR